jgi:hypothetical protein
METKGWTHWLIIYDGNTVYGWNVVRNRLFPLIKAADVVSIAVDPHRGFLFLADDISVTKHAFVVDLGQNKMHPSISIINGSSFKIFKDNEITTIAVDSDNSVLYVSSLLGITTIMYN